MSGRKPGEVESNGVRLSYVESGEGDGDLILVHGGLSDYRSWEAQLQPFAERYHVVAYSRRSHYPNPWMEYPPDYSVGTEGDDLVGLIRGLRLRTPVRLVGASYGGFASMLVARDHPELVRSLVLGEPPVLAALFAQPDAKPLYLDFHEKVERFVVEPFARKDYEGGLRAYMKNVAGRDLDDLPEKSRMVQLQNAQTLVAELLAAEREPFGPEDGKRLKAPALILSGENSVPYLRRTAQELRKLLPSARFEMVSKAGHGMHSQNPAEFNGRVLEFLRSS